MGPRFSGKVREKPQRCERKWGDYETKTSAIPKPRTTEPVMEAVKKTERLNPHPFQPSRREKGKQDHPRAMASLLDPTEGLTDNSRGHRQGTLKV